jgi:hypothetical protein
MTLDSDTIWWIRTAAQVIVWDEAICVGLIVFVMICAILGPPPK